MLFNSYFFLLLFLPLFLFIFFFFKNKLLITIFFSLLFYFFNSPNFFVVFFLLIIINYYFSKFVKDKFIFISAIIFNLLILIYFKYSILFENLFNINLNNNSLILPLGISFYTFNNIIFLFDCKNKLIKKPKLKHFLFLTSFFPHLIAGPFIRFSSIIDQVVNKNFLQKNYKNLLIGIIIFILGLSKKIFLADESQIYVDNFFNKVQLGYEPGFITSWIHSSLFLFQLYFDFSSYSDMAIGLGLMCNIKLPINFDSPLKSKSVIEFWRKWHITLTKIIYEFIFIPISIRIHKIININNFFIITVFEKFFPIIFTFLIVGVWHGGTLNFIIFGLLSGFLIFINHMWRDYVSSKYLNNLNNLKIINIVNWLLTFSTIVISFVFFRSKNFSDSLKIINGMIGVYGFGFPRELADNFDFSFFKIFTTYDKVFGFNANHNAIDELLLILTCSVIAFNFKNLNLLSQNNQVLFDLIIRFKKITFLCLVLIFMIVVLNLSNNSSFIYFNF